MDIMSGYTGLVAATLRQRGSRRQTALPVAATTGTSSLAGSKSSNAGQEYWRKRRALSLLLATAVSALIAGDLLISPSPVMPQYLSRRGSSYDTVEVEGPEQSNHLALETPSTNAGNDMPIKNSISRGFHPVFIYSKELSPPLKPASQVGQDEVIMKLINRHEQNGGESRHYFVDLAANAAVNLSNTLYLEKNGWNGLCIEGNPMYWYELSAFRTCTIIGAFIGGKEDGKQVGVKLSNKAFGGIVGESLDNKNGEEAKRNLVSISTVFVETNVPTVIDYFSLDVEGAEMLVMENFPFEKYKVRFMTVERPRPDLVALMTKHGYKRNPKDFVHWGESLWFHPDFVSMTGEEIDAVSDLKVPAKVWPARSPSKKKRRKSSPSKKKRRQRSETERLRSREGEIFERTECTFCKEGIPKLDMIVPKTGGKTCGSIQLLAIKDYNRTDTCGIIRKQENVCCPGHS